MNCIPLECCNDMRYLGVFFKSGLALQFNFEPGKRKFYASVNNILSRVGTAKPDVVLSLCNSFAVPCLLYGSEAMLLNKSQRRLLDNPFKRLFVKLFNITDNQSIAYCQYYMNCLPAYYRIMARTCKFLESCKHSPFVLLNILYRLIVQRNPDIMSDSHSLWSDFLKDNNIIIS